MTSHLDTAVPEQETSSRLIVRREERDELASLEEEFTTQTIRHCERALDGSAFFRALGAGRSMGPC